MGRAHRWHSAVGRVADLAQCSPKPALEVDAMMRTGTSGSPSHGGFSSEPTMVERLAHLQAPHGLTILLSLKGET